MLLGLLAKLVALLLIALAAVAVFAGGQALVSLLDKSGRDRPLAEVRAVLDSVPVTALEPPPTTPGVRRPAPGIATLAPRDIRPNPTMPESQPHPSRGALRPNAAPAQERPRAPPTRAAASPTLPPAAAPSPPAAAPRLDTAVVAPAPTPAPTPIPGPPPAAPEGLDAVLVDLQIGRLVSRTVVAYRDQDEALVPLGAFFDLSEIRATVSPDGVLEARLEPSGELIRVDARTDSLRVGRRVLALAPGDLFFQEGEFYLATERLGALLDLNIEVNWPELSVTVLNPDSLPVARRMRRDQMRMLLAERNGAHPDTTYGPLRTKWDGLVFDYNVAFPLSGDLVDGSTYQLGLGAEVAGGALEIGVRSLGPLEGGESEFGASWRGVWVENKWLKQLTLGTGSLTGPRYAGIRGVSATNSPYIRPSYVGQLEYYGRLDPGWQLEAYSGSQLVAFDSIGPEGAYDLSLPVSYGENPVDFVAYGPYGQERRFNQTYRVVAEQLPYKDFEYGISGGACISVLCDAAINADLRYGLSRRVTVRGGVEQYWRDSLPDLLHPYAVATGLIGNALTLEGEVVGSGWVRGAFRIEPSVNLRVGAGYSAFDQDVVRSMIAPSGRRSQWLLDAFVRPIPSLSSFYLQAAAELDRGVDTDVSRARLQASVQVNAFRLYPYVRLEGSSSGSGPGTTNEFIGLTAFSNGRPSWGSLLGGLWFRGNIESGGGEGFNLAAVSVAKSLGPPLRVEAGAGWRRGTPGTTFTLSIVSYLPTLQATTTAVAPTHGPSSALQTVQGAIVYDGNQRRLSANPNPGLRRSGVSGRVFIDENGNGLQDPGEPGIGGVRVIVGSQMARSDSFGRFQVWDIPAFDPVKVEVDTNSLDNPLYVPAFTSALVSPPPNAYREVNLPLVTGAVLEGRVVMDGAPISQLTLVLTNTANGKQTTVASFADGTFYLMGVKPGRYTLEVDPRDLAARRLAGQVLEITAQPGRPDQLSNLVLEVRAGP